jgi:hypothetical protein
MQIRTTLITIVLLAALAWNRYVSVLESAPGSPQTVFAGTDGQSLWRYTSTVGRRVYLPIVLKSYH